MGCGSAKISLFEFVLTGFTLVLALVITRVLSGLRWVLAADRSYWVHSVYVANLLILTSLVWWGLWYQRDAAWSYLTFAYNLLIGPGIIYFLAVLLVPEVPRRITDWRAYFFSVRKLLYGALLGLVLAIFVGGQMISGTPLLHWTQGLVLAGLALAVVGLWSDRHLVHAVLALIMAVLIVIAVVFVSVADGVVV